MRLADTTYDNRQTGCCAPVDTAHWDRQEIVWKDKPFLRDHVRALLHVPLNYGSVITRDQAAIEAAEAWPEHPIAITDEVSPWGSDLYVAVDRPVPDADMTTLSGRFLTRVFEGSYRHIARWVTEMTTYVQDQGYEVERIYFHYATCPKCAKVLGKNQVILLARVI